MSSPFCDVIERRACETFKNYRQHDDITSCWQSVWRRVVAAVSVSGIPLGWGGSFCLGESHSRIYPNVCQIWLRSDGRVERGGGGVHTDKGTLQRYIVDSSHSYDQHHTWIWKGLVRLHSTSATTAYSIM